MLAIVGCHSNIVLPCEYWSVLKALRTALTGTEAQQSTMSSKHSIQRKRD